MPNLTIPSPSGATFTVVIKDADNNTVFSGTETNAPFDPGIDDPGDYTVFVTYNGNTNAFCFTIPPCTCPIVESAEIVQLEGGVRQIVFTMTINPQEFCPFHIVISQSAGSSGTTFPVTILTLSDLTFVAGNTYTKTVTLWPTTISVEYQTFKVIPGTAVDVDVNEKCMQQPQTVFFECISPTTLLSDVSVITNFDTNLTYLRIGFQGHCDDFTCNEFTLNYQQLGGTDIGIYSFTADCSNFPSVTYMDFLLNPGPTQKTYKITLTGCCGAILTNSTISCQRIPNADISAQILLIASQYVFRVTINSCGATCKDFRIYYVQSHFPGGGGGAQDVGTSITFSPDCDASFPQTFDFNLSPDLSEPTIRYGFNVLFSPCCTNVPYQFVTYTP